MTINAKHPLWTNFSEIWQQTIDTYSGEIVIKLKDTTYLPATSAQVADGQGTTNTLGQKAYEAYKLRAVFPDIYKDSIKAAIGIMHHKPPTIELPIQMESLLESATVDGEGLHLLLRKINEAQLKTGRIGLLLDMPQTAVVGRTLPYIAIYDALRIINWDNGTVDMPVFQNLNLVVLDESEFMRDSNFEWETKKKYRVLQFGDFVTNEAQFLGVYSQGLFEDGSGSLNFDVTQMIVPLLAGQPLDQIPFTFINSVDLLPDPDNPPLLGLSNLALTIYRGEADYRQSLFMQGQDTLVIIGGISEDGEPTKIGATAKIELPINGDAKFIGVESSGLEEQREALRNDRSDAKELGGKLLDSVSREKEAAESLTIRVAANTATLNQIALAGAEGLQKHLKIMAKWVGLNSEDVSVAPNLDFAGGTLSGSDLTDYMAAKQLGAPLSLETIHKLMQDKDVTKFNFDTELKLIEEEEDLSVGNDGLNDTEEV